MMLLYATVLAAAMACPSPGAQAVVGFWESAETSKGGIGHTLEFNPDGSVLAATTVLVNMRYRVDGDKLVVDESTPGGTLRIERNRLVQAGPDGSVVEKQRVAGPSGKSIVGVWRYQHYAGGAAYERYTPSGQLQFRLALSSYPGCYSVAGGVLKMTQPSVSTTPYEVQGEHLLLKAPGKKIFSYVRVAGGAWYPREPPTTK